MKRKRKKIRVVNKRRLALSITVFLIAIFGVSTYVGKNMSSDYNKTSIVYASNKSENKVDNVNEQSKGNKEKAVVNKEEKKDDGKSLKDSEKNQQNSSTNNEQNTSSENSKKELDNKEFFKQDAFVGDSITEGIQFYEVLDPKNVFAKKGCAVVSAKGFVDNMVQLNPKRAFLLFGMNDLKGYQSTDLFIKDYKSFISDIKNKLPNTEIYVQSILPTANWVANAEPELSNSNIDQYNKALLKMCNDENINFLNIAQLLKGKEDLYEEDGKHTKFDFYDIWLNYVRNNLM